MAESLDRHQSDNDITQTLPPAPERSRAGGSHFVTAPITPPTTVGLAAPRTADSGPLSDEEDGESTGNEDLAEGMQKLSIGGSQPFRYHGKSSGLVFMQSAMAKVKPEDESAARSPPPQTEDGRPPVRPPTKYSFQCVVR